MSDIYVKLGERIRQLRSRAELSQEQLADRMHLSRAAVSQIENGDRKVATHELVSLSQIFGCSVENLLGLESEPQVILKGAKVRQPVRAAIRINVPQKNVEKFREVLLYILNKVGSKHNIGETVIYKLLYFIDFNFYEKYEEQLIGATYIKNRYGPTPAEFKAIADRMVRDKEIVKLEDKYFDYPQRKYLPLRHPDLSKLKAHEIEVIDDVLNRLSDMNATQISEYSHNDVPWLATEAGGTIEYESVFYRTPAYSVRDYGDEIS